MSSFSRLRSAQSSRRLLGLIASLPVALTISSPLFAQAALNWTAAGSSTLGGAGSWNASGTNWWNGSSAVAWPVSGTSNQAIFAGTGAAVTLDSALTTNALSFSTPGYTLSGEQTLTLNGTNPFIHVAGSAGSAVLGNNTALQLAGSAGLNKTGSGSLTLNPSSVQNLTGDIAFSEGTLLLSLANLATPTNLLPATSTVVGKGGTLSVSGKTGAAAAQTIGTLNLQPGLNQVRVGNPAGATGATTTLTVSSLSRSGPGSVVRFNSLVGGFGAASSGTDRLFVTSLSNSSGSVAPTANGTWIAPWAFTGDLSTTVNNLRWAYADTATGQIRQNSGVAGNGTLSNVTDKNIVYTAGNATAAANATAFGVQTNGNITLNLGANTLTTNGFIGLAVNNTATINGTGGLVAGDYKEIITGGASIININAPIADSAGGASALTHMGPNVITLGASNSYTGGTYVLGGRLVVSNPNASINNSSGVFVYPGATFRQDNFTIPLSVPVSLLGGTIDGYGTVGTVTVSNLSSNVVANRTDSPAPLAIDTLVFQGAATLAPKVGSTIVGENTTPVENQPFVVTNLTTTPSAGKVVVTPIAPTGGWAGGSNTYNILTYSNWNGSLSDFVVGTASPAFAARQAATLFLDGNTLKITVQGDKALWTGAANSNWTTTAVGSPFNWNTQVGGQGTEFLANDEVVFDDTATNTNVVISDANVAAANIFVNNETKDFTISSATGFGITAVGNFIKTGAGSLTLGGTNTYTAATTVTEGELLVGSPTAFQGTGSLVLGSNTATTSGTATLDLNGNNVRFVSLTSGTATTNLITNNGAGTGTDTLSLLNPTAAVSALITDGLTRKTAVGIGANAGLLTNANNTFSGGFVMFGLASGGSATGTRLSPVAASNPTVVDGVLTKGPYGIGPVTIGLDATERAQFYFNSPSVVIANPVIVNTTLGTDSTQGALRVEDHSIVVSGPVVANKASVVVHHNGQFSGGPTAGGPNAGEVTGGDITFTGPISTGENPAAGFTAQQTNVATAKRLLVTLANTTTTPNSYTGNTTIGTANVWLRLGATEQIPDGTGRGNVVMSGGTFDLNNFSETINGLSGSGFIENVTGASPVTLTVGAGDATGTNFSGVIFDARSFATTSLVKVGTGIQILSGNNQYTGATTISAGTLQIGGGGTVGSLLPASQIVNNGTLAFNRTDTVTQGTDFANGISGTGSLAKAGSGTLVLNTANTYAGSTTISAGTLSLSGDGTVGSGQVSLASGSTFDVSGSSAATISLPGGLGGSGTVTATGKTLDIGGAFAPVGLAISGNLTLASNAATSLVAGSSPASTTQATVDGSLVNKGALTISAEPAFTFADGQTFTFFTATNGITSGFTSVSVGSLALSSGPSGTWTGSTGGLSYTYSETSATLSVATAAGQLSDLESWRQQFFSSPANTGNGADNFDFDNDGFANLLEYALGTDPTVAGAIPVTVAKSGNFLTLTYPRRTPADPALSYAVEGSSNLSTGFGATSGSTINNGSTSTYTDTVDISVPGTRRFLRLSVSYSPAQ